MMLSFGVQGKSQEAAFQLYHYSKTIKGVRIGIIVGTIIMSLYAMLMLQAGLDFVIQVLYGIMIANQLGVSIYSFRDSFKKYMQRLLALSFVNIGIMLAVYIAQIEYQLPSIGMLLVQVYAFLCVGLQFKYAILSITLIMVIYLGLYIGFGVVTGLVLVEHTIFYTLAILSAAIPGFFLEFYNRGNFLHLYNLQQERDMIEKQKKISDALLLNIFPARVAENLKLNADPYAESYDKVTVLASDIVGFTKLSSEHPPHEVAKLLNDMFSRFDSLAEAYGLEKIKTIGDAYIVVGGLFSDDPMNKCRHPSLAVVNMAWGMIQVLPEIKEKTGLKVGIRVGVSTGPVLAGVIGKSKMAFDVWGDGMHNAEKMESSGQEGRVQVCSTTYRETKQFFEYEKKDTNDEKAPGSYFLVSPTDLKEMKSAKTQDGNEKADVFSYITNKPSVHRASVQFGKAIVIENSLELTGSNLDFQDEKRIFYVKSRYSKTILHLRRISSLGGVIILFFGVIDSFSASGSENMKGIYGALILYGLIYLWMSSQFYFESIHHVSSIFYLFLLGTYTILAQLFVGQVEGSFCNERFILLILFMYGFIGIEPIWILGCAWSTTIGFCLCLYFTRGDLLGQFLLWVACANIVGGMAVFSAEKHMKKDFILRELIEADKKTCQIEKAKSDRLLQSILPNSILEKLKNDPTTIAESFNHASVMFCEIHNFHELVSNLSTKEVFNALGDIFNLFDECVADLGLEKIKTIGEAYMVVGGVPNENPNHIFDMAELALKLMNLTNKGVLINETNQKVDIRIGISCGPAVAGIIGTKKWTYDVWGDVVNVASRMKSTADSNMIQVSQMFADAVSERFVLEKRENVYVKGKGYLTTNVLIERKTNKESDLPGSILVP